ncbi:agmatine deiminase family protein [Streptomyces sp. NBC_00555]|uniref:agmatine deiminase family protein n=1 Tax=Streptomyces sp. NBC_00555 TaxID=2903662 RepID=UPI00224C83DC|nr:agmatine deiminase family protein [Streptomyces sp. NBC_00555]MCX5010106.1 agmatine deiminase family protein [Streptomyces sp. NBC_00555]
MNPSRRTVLRSAGAGAAGLALGTLAPPPAQAATGRMTVPLDDVRHIRTWMAWPSSRAIWGRDLAGVQQDIALIARTVARYEPVLMCAADESSAATARARCGSTVTVISSIPVDDLWMRDTGAVFRRDGAGVVDAIGLNFNGWGGKQTHRKDAKVAQLLAAHESLPFTVAAFVGEGGAVETDGDGTLMATESSLVNKNRNPGLTRAQVEAKVLAAYGADKMIWAPGIKGQDITDDHIDVTSRFVRPGVVMVQVPPADRTDIWARDAREQLAILSAATDAKGRRLQVIRVDGPRTLRSDNPDFVDSYLNFHLANDAVITSQFGDEARDAGARQALAAAFPGRTVVQLDVDRLMGGGGGIHCSTMQQPAAP